MTKFKSTKAYKAFRKLGKNLRKTVKRFFFRRKLNNAPPAFVYQMGKVASSSIFSSLQKQYSGAVGHAHNIGEHNWMSIELFNWAKNGKPLKIISPVREPIGKNISSFFQRFDRYTGTPYNQSTLSIEELIEVFITKFNHLGTLNWLDKNINKNFGINVYDTPFPENGIAEYSHNNVSLLVFRIDISDSEKEKAIRNFLDLPDFKLINRNLSNTKAYHDDYKLLIKKLKIPEHYLLDMSQSKYFKHFYSEDEINEITAKFR